MDLFDAILHDSNLFDPIRSIFHWASLVLQWPISDHRGSYYNAKRGRWKGEHPMITVAIPSNFNLSINKNVPFTFRCPVACRGVSNQGRFLRASLSPPDPPYSTAINFNFKPLRTPTSLCLFAYIRVDDTALPYTSRNTQRRWALRSSPSTLSISTSTRPTMTASHRSNTRQARTNGLISWTSPPNFHTVSASHVHHSTKHHFRAEERRLTDEVLSWALEGKLFRSTPSHILPS